MDLVFFFQFQPLTLDMLRVEFRKKNICFLWTYPNFITQVVGLTDQLGLTQTVFLAIF
jgi:hypothetical protein